MTNSKWESTTLCCDLDFFEHETRNLEEADVETEARREGIRTRRFETNRKCNLQDQQVHTEGEI